MPSASVVSRRPTRTMPAILTAVLLAAPALSARAVADDPPAPASSASPSPAPSPEPSKIDVGGYVDTYYGYSFNRTDPQLRSFDVQHNTFSLSAAELNFTKTATADSRVGFRTDVWFGKAADLTAAYEPESDGKEIYKHVQQAYVSLLTGKLQWDAGKFMTAMGAEVTESQDNWNYTRSILFGYAIPFYHVGLRATYTVDPKLTLGAQLVNGWNNASENNGDKTVHLSLTLRPNAKLTWVANYMVGKEAPDTASVRDVRNLFDTTLTYTATARLSLMANVDYGKEGPVEWWGVAAYAKYQATPAWAAVGRYEYLDDTKGGFMTIGGKAQSVTLTSDHQVAGGLKARLEYRLDRTDHPFFTSADGSAKDSQTTVTVGLVYAFAGRI
jgi:predicted porin